MQRLVGGKRHNVLLGQHLDPVGQRLEQAPKGPTRLGPKRFCMRPSTFALEMVVRAKQLPKTAMMPAMTKRRKPRAAGRRENNPPANAPNSNQKFDRGRSFRGGAAVRLGCGGFGGGGGFGILRFSDRRGGHRRPRPRSYGFAEVIVRLGQVRLVQQQAAKAIAVLNSKTWSILIASNGQTSTQIPQLMQTEISMSNTFGCICILPT
jgi:hypothetical protein